MLWSATVYRPETIGIAVLVGSVFLACHTANPDPIGLPAEVEDANVAQAGGDAARVLSDHAEEINNCFQLKVLQGMPVSGSITLRWWVTKDGNVDSADLLQSSARNPHVERCLVAAVQGWRYPPPQSGQSYRLTQVFLPP